MIWTEWSSDVGEGEEVLFHEIYNIYYRIVAHLIECAARSPISKDDMMEIVKEFGFGETPEEFDKKFSEGDIPVFEKKDDGRYGTPLKPVSRPLSFLEKRWLAAILDDKRMRLFLEDAELEKSRDLLGDMEPLYKNEDFCVVDGANDPDPFDDLRYRKNFRTVLKALREKKLLKLRYTPPSEREVEKLVNPVALQYSVKDDKFRLIGVVSRNAKARRVTMNVSRMAGAEVQNETASPQGSEIEPETRTAVILLLSERDTPERAMIHFSNYECESYKNNGSIFLNVKYNKEDEMEVLIRVLSFGHLIRVYEPHSLVRMIRERLKRQKNLWTKPE